MRKKLLSFYLLTFFLTLAANAQNTDVKKMNNVVAAYYTQASSSTDDMENYYLVLSDSKDAVFNNTSGSIEATNATITAIDFYAPKGSGTQLPEGTYSGDGESLYYDADYSYSAVYDANGKPSTETLIADNVTVKINSDNTYSISFADEKGTSYSFSGTLNFVDMNGGTAVYPQIPTDINATFTGGMAFYHGNLMESNTGNIYINLFDCDFDPETGAMKEKGLDLAICAFNRLFGDPKQATIIPGTYTVARNFKSETFFPGMEIDYSGMTVLMGTYLKRRKTITGADSDYDYGYITSGTITITEGSKEGAFDFVIDCMTDRGHKVTGTAKDITFNIVDVSDDKKKTVESNLDHDVTLDLSYIKKARAYYLGRTNGCNVFTVDIGSPSGKDGDEGDLLRMEFQTSSTAKTLPAGTYELMENDHLWTNQYAPFYMTRGYFDQYGGRTGTRYEHFAKDRYCVVDTFAFVYSGRVGVEKLENDNYHFTMNLADGNGFLINAEWSGPVEIQYDPESGIDDVSNEARPEVNVDGNTLTVFGAKPDEPLSIYGTDGQLLLKEKDASSQTDISSLGKGVYVVKVGNRITNKIVKK